MSNLYEETADELNKCGTFTEMFNIDNETHLAKVVYCYDGDTVHCVFKYGGKYQKFKVRMWGYNAPEIKPSKTIPEDERKVIIDNAYKAKDRLSELVLNKLVTIKCRGFDVFGRVLGELTVVGSEVTVNKVMLDEGLGVEFYG